MENVIHICNQLQGTNSKNEKEKIIKENKDNELFTKVLDFLLNPYVVNGISKKKIKKKIKNDNVSFIQIDDFNALCEYMKLNNTGRDIDILVIQNFLNQNEDKREFYEELITKSLKLGCASNTVNKAYGYNLIPQFQVMLANKYKDNMNKVKGNDFTITLKLDGIRCILVKDGDSVSLFSRQGQVIEGLIDIENEVKDMLLDDFVFDGELLITNTEGIDSKDQYKETSKIVRKDGEKHGITYRIFDYMSLDEFKNQKSINTYTERRKSLERCFNSLIYIKVLPVLYSGNDIKMIDKISDEVVADGQEGVMINLNDAYYEFKRTDKLLKYKLMKDTDLLVTDVIEGDGQNKGKLGAIEIEFIHDGEKQRCNCGSGFTLEERERYFKNPELIVGKIATIQYFEITQNDKGGLGLRFPVWLGRIREDKTEISMY